MLDDDFSLETEPAVKLDPGLKLDMLLNFISDIKKLRNSYIADVSFKIIPAEFSSEDMLKIIDSLTTNDINHSIKSVDDCYHIEIKY